MRFQLLGRETAVNLFFDREFLFLIFSYFYQKNLSILNDIQQLIISRKIQI